MRIFILKKSEDYILSESKKRKPPVELPVELWTEVLREFNSVFNNITIRLKIKYPKLTDRQIILACLIKTGLDSYAIMKYLGLSKTNFRTTKSRLKNILNISSGNKKSLEDFLKDF
ncbi:MAG: hypothetical protein LBU57_03025 [Dysgonamonadaceae bacterium]|nr:hypothetical protein [Dysgonamonadaceae bacterium]